ncbi:hypothetical protein HZQ11_17050 [Elizabethkingia anophelis]|uniref:hypothetical protein n=1 Tax=Elizabethkingia TaxID=308865 RepID=UPI00073984CB|nr:MULTISPECIES: hypothetical protein [Elizabethkingia]KUF40183.1 hypothetical protein AS358_17265 [Elizabethkingia anophelis]MCT3645867.1 hypothetical protein [Elizabethkingia anophelis]MCT3650028.1 hypothetical protein [Elizabethkingia anophelis]MCT3653191.1 hypothetical protein [Elizabethkingia anophelis]MCT3656989.1 hypothetical protein [Elizabethkingia anophelis]
MKNIGKIFIIVLIFCSTLTYAQELSATDKQKIQIVKTNASTYSGKSLKDLFNQLPLIKMLRIIPNGPESKIHTFMIGFINNKDYSNALHENRPREVILVYVEGYNEYIKQTDNKKIKEDITTELAINKYGDLKIFSISN